MLGVESTEQLAIAVFMLLFALPFVGAGGALVYKGVTQLRQGIVLWRSDPVSVMAAGNTEGLVELEGTAARADDYLESPFTETDCLASEYEIQRYSSSDNGSDWKTMHSGSETVPFRLEDETGGLLVDPAGATLSLSTDDSITVGRGSTADEPIASYLETIDVEPGSGSERSLGPIEVKTGDKRRYREKRLHAGDEVHVYGPLERNPPISTRSSDFNAAVRDETDSARFLVSDTDESTRVRKSLLSGVIVTLFGLPFLGIGLGVMGAAITTIVF